MLPRIDSIRQARTKLGITQKRLASLAGVSTSMINQIESGRSQPSYETAKRIFDNLAAAEGHSSSHKAGDFCSTDIVRMRPTDTLNGAIQRMQKYGISQIPVFDGDSPAGVVTEDGIVGYMADHGASGLKRTHVSQIMRPVPPIVDYDTPANVLVPLIRFTKCILVSRNSEIVGIVTALDTLRMME